jgi:hypothetical protein
MAPLRCPVVEGVMDETLERTGELSPVLAGEEGADLLVGVARHRRHRFPARNDHYRAREASLTVEARYDLIRTSPAGRTSPRPPSRGETRKHQSIVDARLRAGRPAPPAPDRLVLRQLVRAAAAGSSGWEDFTERLRVQGVQLRPRMSEKTPGQITGYAVALPGHSDSGQAIWFGGGKLAPDLTLPQLQRRWGGHELNAHPAEAGNASGRRPRSGAQSAAGEPQSTTDRFGLTREERQRLWQAAQDAATRATAQITATVEHGADPRLAGDAAWAAADLLAVVAQLTERRAGGPYTDAARAFEHAGRDQRRTGHVRTPAGRRLRTATTALSAVRVALPSEARQLLQLTQRLIALVDAVARLRQTQAYAAQAAAARAAANGSVPCNRLQCCLRPRSRGEPPPGAVHATPERRPSDVTDVPPEDCRWRDRPSTEVQTTLAGGDDTLAGWPLM